MSQFKGKQVVSYSFMLELKIAALPVLLNPNNAVSLPTSSLLSRPVIRRRYSGFSREAPRDQRAGDGGRSERGIYLDKRQQQILLSYLG